MKKFIKNLSDSQKSEIILFLTSLSQLSELTTSFKLTVSKYFTLKTCSIKDVITEQNKPFTHIYIVKKGAFSLTYLNLKNTPIDFSIEHFIQFQGFSKESFSLNRQYELDGKLKYTLPEKLFTCLPGEFIGDIEWYTKAKNYLFQVTCIHEKSEVLMIDVNLFKEHIQYRIGRDFKDLIVKKMDTINARLNGIRHVEKQCKMNKLGSYENSMKKNLDNLLNYECRARALSAKVKPLQLFNLQQNKSCSHLLNKVRGYLEEDKRGHGGSMANMLLHGHILLDRNGIVEKLKEEAKQALVKQPEKDMMKYYACWHAFDEYLAAKYHNELQYYLCLKYLVDCYLANNGYCILPEQKIERFFKDEEYRAKYDIGEFPNNEFNELVIKCFNIPARHNLKALYDFVIEDGKFDINNFVLRQKIEK